MPKAPLSSCGHFEMRLTYVGLSVQKLWAFFKRYFIGDTLPLACFWREEGTGRYYYIMKLLLPKGWLQNQSCLFRLLTKVQGGQGHGREWIRLKHLFFFHLIAFMERLGNLRLEQVLEKKHIPAHFTSIEKIIDLYMCIVWNVDNLRGCSFTKKFVFWIAHPSVLEHFSRFPLRLFLLHLFLTFLDCRLIWWRWWQSWKLPLIWWQWPTWTRECSNPVLTMLRIVSLQSCIPWIKARSWGDFDAGRDD